jgi:phenylalanyl-tRNA synthetase beta chain
MKIPYNHIINALEENPSIQDLSSKLFQLGHEHAVENNIFDIEITPNRGDCLSLNGILRELNIFYNVVKNNNIYENHIDKLEIDFENHTPIFCPKISFLKIEIDENIKAYEGELKNYFKDLGISKNNFFTDISNYLMYESGQPTHCYDLNKIKGKIILREIDFDLSFETLLDKKINLTEKNNVFFMDNEPINLAGIMGGKNTSCSDNTTSALIECAYFLPEEIIGKPIKYDIYSDAAHKFERRTDPLSHEKVIRRFIQIVKEHAHVKSIQLFSKSFCEEKSTTLALDYKKINKIIGINITEKEYIQYLEDLNFNVEDKVINIPSYRGDVRTQNDLAEEIARVIGYNNITVSEFRINKITRNKSSIEDKLKVFLVDSGFSEVINSPFTENKQDDSIMIDNPLDSNRNFLRTNISKSLINNLLYNERRQKDSIKLFEVSDIYSLNNDKIIKTRKLSVIASGRVGKNYKDFSKKINIKYLKSLFSKLTSNYIFDFKTISRELLDSKFKSEIVYLELDIADLPIEITKYKGKYKPSEFFIQYKPVSEFPSSIRDISFLIKDVSKIELLQELIFSHKDEMLRNVFVFDYYLNKETNEIKIGFRFIFQSDNRTLTVKEIDVAINTIIDKTLKINSITIPGI